MTSKMTGPTLRDIMSPNVVTVGPETTLRDVLEVLVGRRISGVPVVAGEKVVGVISASDLLEFEFSKPRVAAGQSDSMDWLKEEPDLDSGGKEQQLSDYFTAMWENSGADVLERFESVEGPEWDVLEEHTAAEIMTRAVHALAPDTSVSEAARYMLGAGIHRVLAMKEDRLLGLVTTTDIVRAVAEELI